MSIDVLNGVPQVWRCRSEGSATSHNGFYENFLGGRRIFGGTANPSTRSAASRPTRKPPLHTVVFPFDQSEIVAYSPLPIFRTDAKPLSTSGVSETRTSSATSANSCVLWVIAFLLWSRTHSWQRASDHVSLAHLLSASASWWAIRGVMPIHSTGVPNARMTLPPLAVTAYRSSPSSSGVRAPW